MPYLQDSTFPPVPTNRNQPHHHCQHRWPTDEATAASNPTPKHIAATTDMASPSGLHAVQSAPSDPLTMMKQLIAGITALTSTVASVVDVISPRNRSRSASRSTDTRRTRDRSATPTPSNSGPLRNTDAFQLRHHTMLVPPQFR